MPVVAPIKRRKFIRYLKQCGFTGPFSGKRHEKMLHPDGRWLILPNPHESDISSEFLLALLKQAGISREEWEEL